MVKLLTFIDLGLLLITTFDICKKKPRRNPSSTIVNTSVAFWSLANTTTSTIRSYFGHNERQPPQTPTTATTVITQHVKKTLCRRWPPLTYPVPNKITQKQIWNTIEASQWKLDQNVVLYPWKQFNIGRKMLVVIMNNRRAIVNNSIAVVNYSEKKKF